MLYISLLKYGEKRNASRHKWQHKLYEKAGKIRNEFSRRKETDCSKYKWHLIENEDKRFSFEWGVGGEAIKMEVYDKEKNIGYLINIEPIEYDENGNVKNKSLWISGTFIFTLIRHINHVTIEKWR